MRKAEEKYGKKISYQTAHHWLREKFKLRYGKPYLRPSKRPENAKELLEEELKRCLPDDENTVIMFVDESIFRASPTTIRVFNPVRLDKPSDKRKIVVFGGLALNGRSVIHLAESGNTASFIEFLFKVREANKGRKIVLILDNARYHWSADARHVAWQLGITLCYLPPYSPDLNPIEFLWKDLKRLFFLSSLDEIVEKIEDVFLELAIDRRYSYSAYWIKMFRDQIDKYIVIKLTIKRRK